MNSEHVGRTTFVDCMYNLEIYVNLSIIKMY